MALAEIEIYACNGGAGGSGLRWFGLLQSGLAAATPVRYRWLSIHETSGSTADFNLCGYYDVRTEEYIYTEISFGLCSNLYENSLAQLFSQSATPSQIEIILEVPPP